MLASESQLLVIRPLGVLASHRTDAGYVSYAVALLGLAGCLWFGAHAFRLLRAGDRRAEPWVAVAIGVAASAGTAVVGSWLVVTFKGTRFATQLFLGTGILVAGIVCAFLVALSVGTGGREAVGYVLGLVVLAVTGLLLWQLGQ